MKQIKMKQKPKNLKMCSMLYEHIYGKEGLIKKVISGDLKIDKRIEIWE